ARSRRAAAADPTCRPRCRRRKRQWTGQGCTSAHHRRTTCADLAVESAPPMLAPVLALWLAPASVATAASARLPDQVPLAPSEPGADPSAAPTEPSVEPPSEEVPEPESGSFFGADIAAPSPEPSPAPP